MDGTMMVLFAAASFVGTHFLLSHPLRASLVRVIGERGFAILYSVVAFVTLGLTVWAYRSAPGTPPLWDVGDVLWAIATVAMLAASILLLGSLVRNPALPGGGANPSNAQATGVYAITRHPMMWAIAIWGGSHILIYPIAKNAALSAAMIVLALAGAAMQDVKKAKLDPAGWNAWRSRTSYLPFAAIAQGRARLGSLGGHALGGGLFVWLLATWAHIPLTGWPAGLWRWL